MTRSKKQLLQDAYFSLGKTMPVSEITIQKLIDEANISRSTFYYYFEHMLEFTIYLENELLKPMQNFLFTQDAEKNRAQIITALTYFQEKKDAVYLLRYAPQNELLAKIDRLLNRYLNQFLKSKGLEIDSFQRFVICSTFASLIIPSTIHTEGTPTEQSDHMIRLIRRLLQL